MLGALSGVAPAQIDVPYQLTVVSGKHGLQATALACKGKEVPNFTPNFTSRASCYAATGSSKGEGNDNVSESEQRSTDPGIVTVTEEVEVDFESVQHELSYDHSNILYVGRL